MSDLKQREEIFLGDDIMLQYLIRNIIEKNVITTLASVIIVSLILAGNISRIEDKVVPAEDPPTTKIGIFADYEDLDQIMNDRSSPFKSEKPFRVIVKIRRSITFNELLQKYNLPNHHQRNVVYALLRQFNEEYLEPYNADNRIKSLKNLSLDREIYIGKLQVINLSSLGFEASSDIGNKRESVILTNLQRKFDDESLTFDSVVWGDLTKNDRKKIKKRRKK